MPKAIVIISNFILLELCNLETVETLYNVLVDFNLFFVSLL